MSAISYLFWPMMITSFIFRVIRVRLQISMSRLRRDGALHLGQRNSALSSREISHQSLKALGESNNDLVSVAGHSDAAGEQVSLVAKLQKYEKWSDEWRMFLASIGFGISVLCLNLLVSIPFGWYALHAPNGCTFSSSSILLYVIIGLYVVVGLPSCAYMMRGCTDAFRLSSGIWRILSFSPIAYVGYSIFSLAIPKTSAVLYYWPAFNWAILALLIIHTYTIVVPVYLDQQEQKSSNQLQKVVSATSISQAVFVKMLQHDSEYEKLRSAAVEEFSTENPMFWETYVAWMHHCYEILAVQPLSDSNLSLLISGVTNCVISDFAQLRVELTKQNSSALMQIFTAMRIMTSQEPSGAEFDVPLPRKTADIFVKIYHRFIEEGSAFEVNIPDSMRKEVAHIAQELGPRLDMFGSKAAKILPNAVLRFGTLLNTPSTDSNIIVLPVSALDKIKVCVLHSLFTNTFPRYYKRQESQMLN